MGYKEPRRGGDETDDLEMEFQIEWVERGKLEEGWGKREGGRGRGEDEEGRRGRGRGERGTMKLSGIIETPCQTQTVFESKGTVGEK